MRLAAEQAAPSWLPFVLLLIPISIMLFLFRLAARYRLRARQVRRAEARRIPAGGTDLGSAQAISDPSGHTWEALLKALAVRPEPEDGRPSDEAIVRWAPTMLGLRCKLTDSGTNWEPHLFWGERELGQVFIRLGPDERIEGDLTAPFTNRHLRHITVLRVAAPEFHVAAEHGALTASEDSPPEIRGLIGSLAPDRVAWTNARLTGGAEGIVAARPAVDPVAMGWVYDLWLCERIARALHLEPLARARIGPAWKVPYRLGKSLTPSRH